MTRPLNLLLGLICTVFLVTTAQAAIKTERVSYKDGNTALQGLLAWDDAVQGKRPGILVAHEWWGLNDYVRKRAEMLAGLGYVAFALDMYGKGKSTEHPGDAETWQKQITANQAAWRRRAQAGLDTLRRNDKVDPARLGAVGYCFGGATVLQLAYSGADLKGVVGIHAPLPQPTDAEARNLKASVFVATGAADAFVSPEQVQQFQTALEKGGVDWMLTTYAGARHAFTNPDAGKYGIENLQYNEKADQRSWTAMRVFFEELFAKGEK